MEKTGIQEAVEAAEAKATDDAKGATALANLIGVSRQVVLQWISAGFVPVGRARQIALHTGIDQRKLVDPVIRDLFDYTG